LSFKDGLNVVAFQCKDGNIWLKVGRDKGCNLILRILQH